MLKLSKKWDYAIKTIIFLAKNKEDSFTIHEISKQLDISETFLRRVIADLKKKNFVESRQWRAGGIQIVACFQKISLYEILQSVGEDLSITDCTKGKSCDKQHNCQTTSIYGNLQRGLNGFLKLYTIDKLV